MGTIRFKSRRAPQLVATARQRVNSLLLPIPTVTVLMSTEQKSTTIDKKTLETAADIHVFDSQGGQVRFGDLFADQKTVIVFIRTPTAPICTHTHSYLTAEGHFFCGVRHDDVLNDGIS